MASTHRPWSSSASPGSAATICRTAARADRERIRSGRFSPYQLRDNAGFSEFRTPFVNKKILVDLIGLLLIGLVVVVGYKLSPMLLPKSDLTVNPDPTCDLQRQACAVALPEGGRLEVSFGTRPVPLVKPFALAVRVSGMEASRVEIDFEGAEMKMGLNRPLLKAAGDGRFIGEATLPVCVTGAMEWQATVLVEDGRRHIAVPFRFSTAGAH